MTPATTDDPGLSHTTRGAPRDVIDVEWWAADGSVGGLVRLDVRSESGHTAFLAAVVGRGRMPVVVLEHELPRPGASLELRGPGVWVDLVSETPLDHWTIGLEAFGLAVDGGELVTPETFGDRVPVGLDLELETLAPPVGTEGGFRLEVRVHGEVLLADAVIQLDGVGVRRRRWDGGEPELVPGEGSDAVGSLAVSWPRASGPAAATARRHLVDDPFGPRWVVVAH